ncbi:hypothetical protein HZY91_09190 [Facklamia sp. DSM 111018]|uniref:Prenyltransferase n=1 Tax=Facklamia lactis TaxID=2749967 RepID=A0ABS0LSX5_9LACT|nr:hypothetical protein [Facklamia lactis]MBG9981260.1 hypothetical protein [Facklamia lactis]MBG9987062.1 hypothetical protein [Facklamia lactis]
MSYLQHPITKILAGPFALIAFGLITGFGTSTNRDFLSALFLFIALICSNIIDHFQYQKYIKKNTKATPAIIYYISFTIMIVMTLLFMLGQHWIINLLLSLYILFITMQYYPFHLVGTVYHYLLSTFFHSFVLNAIAYFSQANGITPTILTALIPIIFYMAGIELLTTYLRGTVRNNPLFNNLSIQSNKIALGLMIIGIGSGIYFSLPSHSFFIVQILFLVISLISSLPSLIPVETENKVQNKLNYNSTMAFLFTLLYALSFLF